MIKINKEQGWKIANTWLKKLIYYYFKNNKKMWLELLQDRNKYLYYLNGDINATEKFFLCCQLGLEKFNLGVK